MRHVTFKLLLFLLAGAIINLAVAWGCAFQSSIREIGIAVSNDEYGDLAAKYGSSSWSGHSDGPYLQSRFGMVRLAALYEFDHWLSLKSNDLMVIVDEIQAGWPLRSMIGAAVHMEGNASQAARTTTYGCWNVQRDRWWEFRPQQPGIGGLFNDPISIPYRSLWPGFAINTIFYAAVLWMIFVMPFAIRRRRRIKRGLCPACAYPRGASPICTECGASHERRNVPSQRGTFLLQSPLNGPAFPSV